MSISEKTYYFSEPNRYIFPGAEVYKETDNSKDCNDFSDDDDDSGKF